MTSTEDADTPLKKAWVQTHRRHLPVILGIAGFVLLTDLFLHLFISGETPFGFELVDLVILIDFIVLPLAAVNSVFFAQRLFLRRPARIGRKIAISTPAAVLGVMMMSMFLEYIYAQWGFEDDDFLILGDYRASASATNVIEYSLAAFFISLPVFIWQSRVKNLNTRLREKEAEQQRLIQLKTQAELDALQARINPHFLFNSFNSIASLISTDPDKAEKMMVDLSELFRYSLNSEKSHFVTVEEELGIVKTYLSIEKIRFGENLEYDIRCSSDLYEEPIPRFLLQPLVENVVKHATSAIRGAIVSLELEQQDHELIIRLFDNGPAFPENITRGYGLQSTFDKLDLLYPGAYTVTFANNPRKHVFIRLNKPRHHD